MAKTFYGIILTPGKWTYIAGGPSNLSYEEKQEIKRKTARRLGKFKNAVAAMPTFKRGSELKDEAELCYNQMKAEKAFLMQGMAENKINSPRLKKKYDYLAYNKKGE